MEEAYLFFEKITDQVQRPHAPRSAKAAAFKQAVIDEFVAEGALHQLNISEELRRETLEDASTDIVSLLPILKEVHATILAVAWPRWVASEAFERLMASAEMRPAGFAYVADKQSQLERACRFNSPTAAAAATADGDLTARAMMSPLWINIPQASSEASAAAALGGGGGGRRRGSASQQAAQQHQRQAQAAQARRDSMLSHAAHWVATSHLALIQSSALQNRGSGSTATTATSVGPLSVGAVPPAGDIEEAAAGGSGGDGDGSGTGLLAAAAATHAAPPAAQPPPAVQSNGDAAGPAMRQWMPLAEEEDAV
ncbi:hypothetical protein JKP88DRAFT_196718 [Tribonema minus]|uniref:Uncharacterized protein n=1 Tax=Tribonema minus TaxID=303371 RepID=A0A835YJ81_9STRA|nr:hypothetical protein JKP88DRAFT_196718 [Tribonema minus]